MTSCCNLNKLGEINEAPNNIQSSYANYFLVTKFIVNIKSNINSAKEQYLYRKRAPESKRRDTPSLVGVGRSPETGPRRMWACFWEGLRTGLRRTVLKGVCGRTGCGSHCGYLGDFWSPDADRNSETLKSQLLSSPPPPIPSHLISMPPGMQLSNKPPQSTPSLRAPFPCSAHSLCFIDAFTIRRPAYPHPVSAPPTQPPNQRPDHCSPATELSSGSAVWSTVQVLCGIQSPFLEFKPSRP